MNFFSPDQLKIFKETPGAMSVHEGAALFNLMGIIPDEGLCVECGSHMGKSAIAIASGMERGPQRVLHLVDPLFVDEELERRVVNLVQTPKVVPAMWSTLSPQVLTEIQTSTGFEKFAFVFLDSGDHDYELVRSEADYLLDKMLPGGIIAFHDVGNYQGPLRVWKEIQLQGFENVPIPWDEIKVIVAENGGEASNNSWHKLDDPTPCYLAAVRKV